MKGINIQSESTYFVDTNIWLYSFIKSQAGEKSKIAKSIISGSDIIISTQIINPFSHIIVSRGRCLGNAVSE